MENNLQKKSGVHTEKLAAGEKEAILTKTERIKKLKAEQQSLEKDILKDKFIQQFLIILGLLLLLSSTFLMDLTVLTNAYENPQLTRILTIILGIILASMSLVYSPYENKVNLKKVKNDLEFLDTGRLSDEAKAEELFNHHHLELSRYYDEKLLQSFLVFRLGFAAIIASFVFMALTFYLINKFIVSEPRYTLVIGAVGAIGVVLTDFVAVVFLKMHSDIVKSGNEYHSRLVQTQHYHFANYLVSKVDNKVEKEKGLVKLALGIIHASMLKPGDEIETDSFLLNKGKDAYLIGVAEELRKLKALNENGLINDEEYYHQKKKLLS